MQSNNDLTITILDTRYEGTISGDEIALTGMEEGCPAEINGMVLNENEFAGTQVIDCATTHTCMGEAMRNPEPPSNLEPPAFSNLTGTWRLTDRWQCDPDPDIAAPAGTELTLMQSNNDLTITILDTRYEGTISGDEIALTGMEEGCPAEINGMVLNENEFTGTQVINCTTTTHTCMGEAMR